MTGAQLTLADVARVERSAFLREFPMPALVLLDSVADLAGAEGAVTPVSPAKVLDAERTEAVAGLPHRRRDETQFPLRPDCPVLLVTKRTRLTPFDDVITLGRAPTQDVVIERASVSKLHACFTRYPEGWRITDQRSTNGTYLEGKRIAAQVPTLVPEGAEISFSSEVRARFHLAESLHDLATYVLGRSRS